MTVVHPTCRPDRLTILGFVGRRQPDHADQSDPSQGGPKYLNTADTVVFHKGAQLYGFRAVTADSTPVLVEGPVDAIAVSLAGHGSYVGVAHSGPH